MMSLGLLPISLILLSLSADYSNAFTPSHRPTRSVVKLHASTIEQGTHIDKKPQPERLTSEEEDLLFGQDADYVPHPPFPMQHRVKDKFGNILNDPVHPLSPLDYCASDPLVNKLATMRNQLQSCPELWMELAKYCPDKRALLDEHLCDDKIDYTFAQMNDAVQKSASVFTNLGVNKGVNVAIFAENSAVWLLVDHGLQLAGGASAVRGADAPLDELRYIYEHSDSAGVVVLQGPKLLQRLATDAKAKNMPSLGLSNAKYGPLKTIILMHREKKTDDDIAKMAKQLDIDILVFSDLLAAAQPLGQSRRPKIGKEDLATIVYTSGTTGRPKGVMLTHGNLLHQTGHRLSINQPYEESEPMPGDIMVSLLPVWHITERTFELWMASRGCAVVYSTIRTFKNDLAKHKPQWMVLVPRVLEKIAFGVLDKFSTGGPAVQALSKFFTKTSSTAAKHRKIASSVVAADDKPGALTKFTSKAIVAALAPVNAVGNKLVWGKVKDGFGGRVKTIISGGSALAGSLESFYEAAGLRVCVGYGLTECSPLLAYRRSDANLVTAGCAGLPCLDTEIRIVDPESKVTDRPRPALPDGQIGVVIGRGPQVMKGYYKNPVDTAKAVDKFGWFDTGDLGRINPATGDLILTGRAKDTIVLSNGENIEPVPIEDAIMGASPYVSQIMLTGQDGRSLVAIIVLSVMELFNGNFLTKEEADILQVAGDKVNDPKCSEEDCERFSRALNEAADRLRSNSDLKAALKADVSRATKEFRKWEQVSEVYLTLEPFAMANGLLTQSYKVKRDQVTNRYKSLLPK
ncbi:hypothetical protein MPSEU_000070700 [Mayamaea pseudoterrestris]|nr:hypothetical protein MPSEU_000070700 [Mayamaea pseudoterrestris]